MTVTDDVYSHLNEMKEPQEETYDTHAQRLRRVTSEIWTMIVTCMVLMIALLFLMERRMMIILLQNIINFFTMIDDYFIIEQNYKFLHFLFSMIIVFGKKIKTFLKTLCSFLFAFFFLPFFKFLLIFFFFWHVLFRCFLYDLFYHFDTV